MYTAIVALPLLGAIIAGLFHRYTGDRVAMYTTTGFLIAGALLSCYAFWDVAVMGHSTIVPLFDWIQSGDLQVTWTIRVDTLTAIMLVVVNGVSSLVHLYSIGYMADDPHRARFFAYMSLFTFFMLMLVTSNNFLQMYFGWEGVGLASYLLIGFWYEKPSANAAAIKAFVVNRVGDFGFALGVFAIFFVFGTLDFDAVFSAAPGMKGHIIHFAGMDLDLMTTICVLLFVGAMGKSAQVPLHTWLPDAMEGPTPISALIHAATMVTAGVFLVCRCSPLFAQSEVARDMVIIVGGFTAFFAATVGLFQNDIKRVIAYSTCSQLGYMFVAAGVSAYGAAMFHLFTHAFFKALLFLGAGSVINAVHHEQDMRKMGGLMKHIPYTWLMMLIGTIAITGLGIPYTPIGAAGFFSKDAIIEVAYNAGGVGTFGFIMTITAAGMTAFYSWRLMFMTFNGKFRGDHHTLEHIHESPKTMLIPITILAIGALLAGLLFWRMFVGDMQEAFWRGAIVLPHGEHEAPLWVVWAPFVMSIAGLGIAYFYYIRHPEKPAEMAAKNGIVYNFIYHKWYFDELYDFLFVQPALRLGRFLWKKGDGATIDGLGPDGIAARVLDATRGAVRLQTGYVYHYAFAMLVGVAALITYFLFSGHA